MTCGGERREWPDDDVVVEEGETEKKKEKKKRTPTNEWRRSERHASLTGNALFSLLSFGSFRDSDYYRLIVSSLALSFPRISSPALWPFE